jgi:F-type H+-transporting ATPase subunit b
MRIDWWTLGLQAINVLVLVWILARFLFRPVAAIVLARQAEAVTLLDEAHVARDEAVAERTNAAAETARIIKSQGERLKAAALEGETEKSAILAAARTEADQVRETARVDIERVRKSEADATDDRACALALDIAAKVLGRLPDAARVAGFIDGLAEGIAALPEAARTGIDAVRLRAARALNPAETEACHAMLTRALGRPVAITAEADPGLMAGLEMDTPHAVVRNSFRADLDRIGAALKQHVQP